MSGPDYGLTPTRPRLSMLEASVLEQLRELRADRDDLRARVEALEAATKLTFCDRCGSSFCDGGRYCGVCTAARNARLDGGA